MKLISFYHLPALSLAALLTACSDPTVESPPAAAPVKPPESVSLSLEPAATPALNPSGQLTPTPSAPQNNALPGDFATEKTLHTINIYLIEYQANGGQIPATVEEMVQAKIIPRIPPPPEGKKFSVDTKKAMISFADI